MASVNTLQCLVAPANTGVGACYADIKNIVGIIICPPNYYITATQAATLQTKLNADALNDSKGLRIYPVGPFVDFKDDSEKRVVEQFSYGGQKTVRDPVYKWSFRFNVGGYELLKSLRSFNGGNWSVLFVDGSNQLWGTNYTASDGAGIAGIPLIELYTDPFMINDGKKNTEYWTSIVFYPINLMDNGAYIKNPGFDVVDTLEGIQNVVLASKTNATAKTFTVIPTTNEGTLMSSLYGTQLAAVGAWTAKNHETGAALTITGVTQDSVSGGFNIVVGATNYPTVGTGHVDINLVGPTELAALNVSPYESTGLVSIVAS